MENSKITEKYKSSADKTDSNFSRHIASMVNKYEERNSLLAERETELRRKLKFMENTTPAIMLYNMWTVMQKNPGIDMKEFVMKKISELPNIAKKSRSRSLDSRTSLEKCTFENIKPDYKVTEREENESRRIRRRTSPKSTSPKPTSPIPSSFKPTSSNSSSPKPNTLRAKDPDRCICGALKPDVKDKREKLELEPHKCRSRSFESNFRNLEEDKMEKLLDKSFHGHSSRSFDTPSRSPIKSNFDDARADAQDGFELLHKEQCKKLHRKRSRSLNTKSRTPTKIMDQIDNLEREWEKLMVSGKSEPPVRCKNAIKYSSDDHKTSTKDNKTEAVKCERHKTRHPRSKHSTTRIPEKYIYNDAQSDKQAKIVQLKSMVDNLLDEKQILEKRVRCLERQLNTLKHPFADESHELRSVVSVISSDLDI